MMTFNELKNDVYEIAQAKFGLMTPEFKQRLDVELNAIERYGKTELIVILWWLFQDLAEKNIYTKLRLYDGYGVSLVCYVLGITLFNPLEHPKLITEQYVLNTIQELQGVSIKIDVNNPEIIETKIKDWGYEYEKETFGSMRSLMVTANEDANSDFKIYYQYRANVCRLQRAYHLDRTLMENIPLDDKDTFDMINELDLYGTTTTCLAPITLEALRLIRPESLGELAIALAFMSEKQYDDLLEFVANRATGWNNPTGRKEVDDLLTHTNGVLLFSRQKRECLKWLHRSYWDEDKWQVYTTRVKRLLQSGQVVNKCDTYLEAYNLYKLAYLKLHHPTEFSKILTTK